MPVIHEPNLKSVVLLGDSIRLSYQPAVTRLLTGEATVWGPEENGMHSLHHVFNLSWYLDTPADVIHFNFGLWDCRRLGRDSQENAVPEALFARNLDCLLQKTSHLAATRIWATITPVKQKAFDRYFTKASDPWRCAEDCERYNEAAKPVLERHSISVNDLHSWIFQEGIEQMIGADGVHLTPYGEESIGHRVAEKIREFL